MEQGAAAGHAPGVGQQCCWGLAGVAKHVPSLKCGIAQPHCCLPGHIHAHRHTTSPQILGRQLPCPSLAQQLVSLSLLVHAAAAALGFRCARCC